MPNETAALALRLYIGAVVGTEGSAFAEKLETAVTPWVNETFGPVLRHLRTLYPDF